MKHPYTHLVALIAQADEVTAHSAVEKLIAHLKQTGRIKLLPALLRELKETQARQKTLRPVVEVAHEGERGSALTRAGEQGISAENVVINPSLISGWRAKSGGVLVDRSAKRALLDIYKKVIA